MQSQKKFLPIFTHEEDVIIHFTVFKATPHNCVAQNAQKIFRQIDQKAQAILCVLSSIFGRYDEIIGKQDA